MADTSLIIGNGNWAVKEDSLLGYNIIQGKYVPIEMNVSRATTATRVNSGGLIELVPRNLLTYSQQIDNTDWVKTATTVTANTTTSPDGTTTADTVTGIGVSGVRLIQSNSISFTTGTSYSLSVFAKKGTNDFIQLFVPNTIGGMFANFDINTGVVGTLGTNTGTTPTSSIINYGNGWYRCTINFTATTTTSTVTFISIVTSASAIRSEPNTLTTSIILWGAQAEAGSTATEYFPTTDRFDIPRVDYSTGTASLLVEPARTNLVLYSEQFDNAIWTKSGVTITANFTTAPDGNNTADLVTPTSLDSNLRQGFIPTGAIQHNFSVYLRSATGSSFSTILRVWRNVTFTSVASTPITVTTEWQRFDLTFTTLDITEHSVVIGSNSTLSIGENFNAWGAQLEAGSNATSYIPTVASQLQRNADVISKTGVSSLIGQTEGTLYFEVQGFSDGNLANHFITLSDGTVNNQIGFNYNTSGVITGYFRVNAFTYLISSTVSKTLNSKIILKYNSSNVYTLFINGFLIGTGTAASSFTSPLTTFKTSQGDNSAPYNGNIKSIVLYKTALLNQQCIDLTN
jgi:hypothetical protein